ncbi:MAG: protein translocase subunit SecD, partial [Candidatus Planktophila sp.]
MSTSNKPVKSAARPGRTLVVLSLVILALLATVLITGATTVRLGLDLRGGTSVTLQPRIAPGENGKVTTEAIDQAVSIIRQRVNSLGVAESEVAAQGSGTNRQIIISIPGDTGRRVVELVGQTAELRFRQVLATAAGTPSAAPTDPTATPAAAVTPELNARFAALDCTKAENLQGTGSDDAASAIVACDRSGGAKYILDKAEVLGRQVAKATAGIDQQGG